jgi:hypothetical protein
MVLLGETPTARLVKSLRVSPGDVGRASPGMTVIVSPDKWLCPHLGVFARSRYHGENCSHVDLLADLDW